MSTDYKKAWEELKAQLVETREGYANNPYFNNHPVEIQERIVSMLRTYDSILLFMETLEEETLEE